MKNDGSTAFAARPTYAAVAGNTGAAMGSAGAGLSFQVWADKTQYLRHQNFQLFAQPLDASDLGKTDSTFAVLGGYTAAP